MDLIGEKRFIMSQSGRHIETVSCRRGLRKKPWNIVSFCDLLLEWKLAQAT